MSPATAATRLQGDLTPSIWEQLISSSAQQQSSQMILAIPPLENVSSARSAATGECHAWPQARVAENTRELSQASASSEAQLIRRVGQRDPEAFAALYDCYSKPLYSFVLRILNDPQEAEDVLQEVFLRIWEKASCFDEAAGKPFTWAISITRNKAIDRLRTRQRKLQVFGETDDSDVVVSGPGETQRDENVWRDLVAQIRRVVEELPGEQRESIELAFFNGLTHMEIARALEEPLGTVKARIRRGMLRLRDSLAGTECWCSS